MARAIFIECNKYFKKHCTGCTSLRMFAGDKMAPSHTLAFFLALAANAILLESANKTAQPDIYRLPKLFAPASYEVALVLPPEVFTEDSAEFSGKVLVHFSFTNLTDFIAINADHKLLTIKSMTLNNDEIPSGNYSVDNVTDIVTIKTGQQMMPGTPYELAIEYNGNISTTDLAGIHRVTYRNRNGVKKYMVSTQFGSVTARRAFPCFDEPSLKATFDFTVTFPTGLNVLFNTREMQRKSNEETGLTTVRFKRTPKMSTYVLGLVVSDLTCTPGPIHAPIPHQVCSREEYAHMRGLALEYIPKLLEGITNFTNYKYTRNMEKLDHIAIPEFAHVAMENWGLITYRERALLWDKDNSDDGVKQYIIFALGHEMTHLWFGDLVTFKWFSEVLMKEGFATHLSYFVAQQILPEWEYAKQFVTEELRPGLLVDVEKNYPLQTPTTIPEIESRYKDLSYKKGASMMRMVHHFMELENFREGLRDYLLRYQFSNTEPDDLWLILSGKVEPYSKLPASLNTVMSSWIKKSGFPLLTVSLIGNEVQISQTKFLYSGHDDETKWYVPISYTTSVDFNKFQKTTPNVWLTPYGNLRFTLTQKCDWIILNNQVTGFYRVKYDAPLLDNIKTALHRGNYDGITDLNRAQIVDDLLNLARAQQMRYATVLDILRFLKYDESYYSWHAALDAYSGFKFLLRRVGEYSPLGQVIKSDMLDLMTSVYRSVPFSTIKDDDHMYTMKQMLILHWMCKLGEETCVEAAQEAFKHYKLTRIKPHRNFRAIIYCNALRYSKDPSDWHFLWDAYLESVEVPEESITLITALGCTKDTNLLKEYLTRTVTEGSGYREPDPLDAFKAVGDGNFDGLDVVFDFVIEHHKMLEEKYTKFDILGILIRGLAERVTSQDAIDKKRKFIETGDLSERFKNSAIKALDDALGKLQWLDDIEQDMAGYYGIVLPHLITYTHVYLNIFYIFIACCFLIALGYFVIIYRRALWVVMSNFWQR